MFRGSRRKQTLTSKQDTRGYNTTERDAIDAKKPRTFSLYLSAWIICVHFFLLVMPSVVSLQSPQEGEIANIPCSVVHCGQQCSGPETDEIAPSALIRVMMIFMRKT